MARKRLRESQRDCKDCVHSYDWRNIGANGQPIFCRCKYYAHGKYCKFLTGRGCNEHFKPR